MSLRRAGALVTACLLISSMLGTPAYAETHDVTIHDFFFSPKTLKIKPGDTVRWTATASGHTVTEGRAGAPLGSSRFNFDPDRTLNAGEQRSWTFPVEEYVYYRCRVHISMEGLIQVGNPPGAPVPETPSVIVPDDVPTIADAATSAQPGTRVLIRPGVFREEVVVTVPRLEIIGLGEQPDEVVLNGEDVRNVGLTVSAPGVRISNLTVTQHARAGIAAAGVSGMVVSDAVVADNTLYGVDAREPAGLTVRGVRVTGHGIAGIGVRGCVRCGALIEDVQLEGNAAGLVAVDATGVIVRSSRIQGNAVGAVLKDVGGSQVSGNTLRDNDSTGVWVAAVFRDPQPPTGAGVWISGGGSNLIASNTATGHTYNIAVTGPAPVAGHRIQDNVLGEAEHADIGVDAAGAGLCLSGNGQAATHPMEAAALYACDMPATVIAPYPVVTANLFSHAREAGYPV